MHCFVDILNSFMGAFPRAISILNGKIAFYKIHKVGHSSVIAWLNLINNPDVVKTYPSLLNDDIWQSGEAQSGASIKIEWRDDVVKAELPTIKQEIGPFTTETVPAIPENNEVRFCVVRDPINRFVSAYKNQIVSAKVLGDNPPTMSEFIHNFDYYLWKNREVEFHFRQLVFGLGYDPSVFTHIFNIKQFSEIKKLLESYCDYKLPNIRLNKSIEADKKLGMITEEELDFLKRKYAIDYEVYGKWFEPIDMTNIIGYQAPTTSVSELSAPQQLS